jgi:ATP-dependent RNA helicase DDX51/DBP6
MNLDLNMSEVTPTVKVLCSLTCFKITGILMCILQTRTKAKNRYLKGKKERRKQRRALANANKSKPSITKALSSDGEVEDDEDMVEVVDADEVQTPPQSAVDVEMEDSNPPPPLETRPPKERRPKKKRRKETAEEAQQVVPEDIETTRTTPPAKDVVEVPSSVPVDVYIPSFPLPSQPPMASKAQRTLQGMDSAMLDAEIVDPTLTSSLYTDGQNIGKLLSPRMLKRLADIGVTELFAGE